MAFDFPTPSTVGEIFTPVMGLNYRWTGTVWETVPGHTALPFNYFINPIFSITQEAQANTVGNGKYPVDHNVHYTTQNVLAYQAPFPTINGSQFKLVCMNQAAVASIAATDFSHTPVQYMEGRRVAGFKWGTAVAENAVLRFSLRTRYAGTFAVGIRNSATNRSYTMQINSPANVETMHSFAIPGDTTGAWVKDAGMGINVTFTWYAGTNYQTAPGIWTAGNFHAVPGMTNALLNADAYWELSDVGFYRDPFKTGVAPPWEVPSESQILLDCYRYWYMCRNLKGVSTGTSMGRGRALHPTPMRATPSITKSAAFAVYAWDNANMGDITSIANYSNTTVCECDLATAVTFGATGTPNMLLSEYPGYLEVSARY